MRIRDAGAVLSATVGLAASLASLVDYLGADPTFCAESGCATVRESAWSHPLGIPMPFVGVAFFAAMLALAVVRRPRVRAILALAGGAWAALLIGLQGHGDAMAAALFAAEPAELTRDGCERIAARVGLDLGRYRRDRDAPEVAARLAADLADARAADVHSLPTLFIGSERVVGSVLTANELADLVHRTQG